MVPTSPTAARRSARGIASSSSCSSRSCATAIGDPDLCLPYWDWTKDRSAADPGFPFTVEFLGGDGFGNANDQVTTGDFAHSAGWTLNCDEEGFGYLRRHLGGDGPGLPTPQSVRDCLIVTPYDSPAWNRSSSAHHQLPQRPRRLGRIVCHPQRGASVGRRIDAARYVAQ